MKLVTILSARPKFIKAAAVSREIKHFNKYESNSLEEVSVHTGQHFDPNMTDVFL